MNVANKSTRPRLFKRLAVFLVAVKLTADMFVALFGPKKLSYRGLAWGDEEMMLYRDN